MKRIVLSDIEDPKLKIVCALYNRPNIPLRQTDLKKSTGMGFHQLDYQITTLVEEGVVLQVDGKKGKEYLLSDVFYDDTLLDAMEIVSEDLAKLIGMMLDTDDIMIVTPHMKRLMDLFCEVLSQ